MIKLIEDRNYAKIDLDFIIYISIKRGKSIMHSTNEGGKRNWK